MMDLLTYVKYTQILRDELIPATGCTEPIALAWAAAMGRKMLPAEPESILCWASASIIKNVKSVVVPNTDGLKGIEAAVAAGVTVGAADKELEVLSAVPADAHARILSFMDRCPITVKLSASAESFDILLEMKAGEHSSRVRIAGHHTNVVLLEQDGKLLKENQTTLESVQQGSDDPFMTIKGIYEYAKSCRMEDVEETIQRQIDCNVALANAGMSGEWGAQIGRMILEKGGTENTLAKARAYAAAGSDARMSGCEMPAVINSGSGNQGLTITLPVVTYAEAMYTPRELLIRALVFANLSSIRIKKEIGCLSAYCGAVCAGCAAGAGIGFLRGDPCDVLERAIVNGLAILSGTICDGAKPSCAAKIAMSVEAGVMALEMAERGNDFHGGDGIVKNNTEETIHEVGTLCREGMSVTNDVVLNIMLGK